MRQFSSTPIIIALAIFGVVTLARADVLLMERVQHERGDLPTRGLSMAQVESRYGVPDARFAPVGGEAPRHPAIDRWEYSDFIVY